MKVLVKKDSATSIPIDCGEGKEGEAKLRQLVDQFGSGVTNEDGSPVVLPEAKVEKNDDKKAEKNDDKPFAERTKAELHEYLDAEGVEYFASDDKDELVKLAKAEARKKAKANKGDE